MATHYSQDVLSQLLQIYYTQVPDRYIFSRRCIDRQELANKAGHGRKQMSTLVTSRNGIQRTLLWAAIIVLGAVSLGIVALSRGETISAAWLVVAALCVYFVAYRFYALFIADKVLGIDPSRQTPAYRHNDGLDYVPTNRYVLFGHVHQPLQSRIRIGDTECINVGHFRATGVPYVLQWD